MWYLMRLMKQAKPEVIYARRKARQAKLERADFTPYAGGANQSSTSVFNASETDIPLNHGDLPYGGAGSGHQQWDEHGKAVGYSGLFQPQPQRAPGRIPTYRTEGGGGYDSQGHRYDMGPGGVAPVRQESEESIGWDTDARQQGAERIHLPKVGVSPPRMVSPPGFHSPLDLQNPFDGPAPTTARQASHPPPIPPPPAPMTISIAPPPGAASPSQSAPYQPQPPVTSTSIMPSSLPNPYGAHNATPTQFNHPYVPSSNTFHDQEATDDSFLTADGHSRAATENAPAPFSPPPQAPPSHTSNELR